MLDYEMSSFSLQVRRHISTRVKPFFSCSTIFFMLLDHGDNTTVSKLFVDFLYHCIY